MKHFPFDCNGQQGLTTSIGATPTPLDLGFSPFFSKIFMESFQYIIFQKIKNVNFFVNTIMLRLISKICQDYGIFKNSIFVLCVFIASLLFK
jgi:hypothetical protein